MSVLTDQRDTFADRFPATDWSVADQSSPRSFGELKPANVPPSQEVLWATQQALIDAGATPWNAGKMADIANTAAGFTPLGSVVAAADARHSWRQGNYGQAALDAAGVIPGVSAGYRAGKALGKSLLGKVGVGAGAGIGALFAPEDAEAANLRKLLTATSVFEHDKPGGRPQDWHRIASRKLDRPLQDISVDLRGTSPRPSMQVNPADLEGKFLMPLPGDPTTRGVTIHGIDDIPLSTPFKTQGGMPYINELEGFANAPGAASTAARRVGELQDQFGTDVIGTYLKMGPQSADFSSHTWAPLARMFEQSPMTKTGKQNLNTEIRREFKESTAKGKDEWPGKFPGVESKQLEEHLATSPDQYRKAFINAIEKQGGPRSIIPGVPDVIATRYAATHPDLLNAPAHSSGMAMTTLTGKTRPSTHRDYPVHLEGTGSFGFGQQLPREVMWPEMIEHFDKLGKEPADWARVLTQTPLKGRPYGQLATPRWVEDTSRFMENSRKMGESAALDQYLFDRFGWK